MSDIGARRRRRPHVLLGCCGSVASVKVPALVNALSCLGEVRVVATDAALAFMGNGPYCAKERRTVAAKYDAEEWDAFAARTANGTDDPASVHVLTDRDEWREVAEVGDKVLHIELRRWADVFVVAPCSANTLAKLANGLSDNLLTCVARAWPIGTRPLLCAAAMNTAMWEHPFTAKHVSTLREELGVLFVPPVAKRLACGDVGMGALASVASIVGAVRGAIAGGICEGRGDSPCVGAGAGIDVGTSAAGGADSSAVEERKNNSRKRSKQDA